MVEDTRMQLWSQMEIEEVKHKASKAELDLNQIPRQVHNFFKLKNFHNQIDFMQVNAWSLWSQSLSSLILQEA